MEQKLCKQAGSYSNLLLDDAKTKDVDSVGNVLVELVTEVESFNPKDGNMGKLFKFFENKKKQLQALKASYESVGANISKIEEKLKSHQRTLLTDVQQYGNLSEKIYDSYNEICLYIIAGRKKIEELKPELVELQKKAQETGDPKDAAEFNKMQQAINELDKRVFDLESSKVLSMQMNAQCDIIKEGDVALCNKITSSLTQTIAAWKTGAAIAIGLQVQENVLKYQQQLNDATDKMLRKNADMLKDNSTKIIEQAEQGTFNTETLVYVNQSFIDTINNIIETKDSAIKNRESARRLLAESEAQRDKAIANAKSYILNNDI